MRIARNLEEGFFEYREEVRDEVKRIIDDVRQNGDEALKRYTSRFDGVSLKDLRVDFKIEETEIGEIKAIKTSIDNVKKFAEKQLEHFKNIDYEIAPGVFTGQRVIPIERVGIYVPGGRYPLVSTLIMCAVPAKVAGVGEIVICTPPSYRGTVHPVILAVVGLIGVHEVYAVGGAQAIAAMAYGTETIKKVDKIVGPGNRYINLAKKEVFGAVGIDFIAGPTEILIIADETSNPEIIAADLLAQAEHDVDALPILVTNSTELAERVQKEVKSRVEKLQTKDVAGKTMEKNGVIVLVDSLEDAVTIANRRAPEHLELQVKEPGKYVDKIKNYGTLFIGKLAAVALGDYSSGLNHTLPTNTGARYTGGLSVKDFLKLQTALRVTEKGIKEIGPVAKTLAKIEGLDGHARSIEVRIKKEGDGGTSI